MWLRRGNRRGAVLSDRPRLPAWEALETRQLMSITPGWSVAVGGGTLTYELLNPNNPASPGILTVAGTGGDDRIVVSEDPGAPRRMRFDVNGSSCTVDLADLSNSLNELRVLGGAGNDLLVSELSHSFVASNYAYSESGVINTLPSWWVYLNGGDGTDALYGGSAGHSLWGEAGDDLLVAGDGRTFLLGGDGDDTLYGHAFALDGHGRDPSYDLL